MLKGKTAVVTGGSRGIGAAIAKKLASMGADVAILYAGNQQAAESVCQLAEKEQVEMPICRCAYEVLYHGKQASEVVGELMGRAKKDELLERTWM